jgi:hypothetical protein
MADQVVAEFVKMGFVNMMDYIQIGADTDPHSQVPAHHGHCERHLGR